MNFSDLITDDNISLGGRNNTFSAKPERIIVVGSSGSGKTTLINYIKNKTDLVKNDQIYVPKRYITREKRENDDTIENCHVNEDKFLQFVSEGKIDISWQRDLGGDKKEHYGFAAANQNGLPLYSGNNAIVQKESSLVPDNILANSIIIGIYTPDDIREERFSQRSPDIMKKAAEATKRLQDNSKNILAYSDIVIHNIGNEEEIGQSFYGFLEKLVNL